jgi:hypothetical protein
MTLEARKPAILHFPYKKTFDIIAEGVVSANRQTVVDSFVTWIRSADLSEFERCRLHSGLRKALQNCPEFPQ